MQQFIQEFIGELSGQFYIYQVLAIVLFSAYGFGFVYLIRGKNMSVYDMLLAYPLSLIVYSVCGFFLLSAGIPFNRYTELLLMAVVLAVTYFAFRNKTELKTEINVRKIITVSGIILVLALISVSGIISVSVTNDSMYFFSEYPRALIYYGNINAQLDNFLTDASQGIAVLGTVPFFFGFDEMFGIQTFLNINFLAYFAYAVYEIAQQKLEKYAKLMAFLGILFLLTSMPYVLMSRWFMANAFFMEYFVIVIYSAYKYRENRNQADLLILSVLITGISIMRMEGALNAGVIVLCIMMLEYTNKEVVSYMVLPMLVLQAMYLFRVFFLMTLHTDMQFMTKEKAAILIAFLLAIIAYCLLIRNRDGKLEIIKKYYRACLAGGLVLVNAAVLLYDYSDYIINLKAFIINVLRNSGWGLFASFVIGIIILIPKKSIKINYFDITVICFVLLTVVAGWARGDALHESFGDSGNRMLIQVVPAMILALLIKVMDGIYYMRRDDTDNTEIAGNTDNAENTEIVGNTDN